MPKTIELTVQFQIQRVSCPGVWLCQDGRVSLSVFALGTNYQTCLLPPMFPLLFKDIFYFRKRFQEKCALSNMCCLLKDETIYCELVQWCEDCNTGSCVILAQYLGALNDVLFPSDVCSNDGVDLLMRRSKEFPGILSPKIEIATKVRIDEVWNDEESMDPGFVMKPNTACQCNEDDMDGARQKQVCHSPNYHRTKCAKANFGCGAPKRPISASRSRSHCRSHSNAAARPSHCSLLKKPERHEPCKYHIEEGPALVDSLLCSPACLTVRQYVPGCPCSHRRVLAYPIPPSVTSERRPRSTRRPRCSTVNEVNTRDVAWTKNINCQNGIEYEKPPCFVPRCSPRRRPPPSHGVLSGARSRPQPYYNVYHLRPQNATWNGSNMDGEVESDTETRSDTEERLSETEKMYSPTEDRLQKILLESRYIEEENRNLRRSQEFRKPCVSKFTPCVCEICRKYHELFHTDLYCVKDQV